MPDKHHFRSKLLNLPDQHRNVLSPHVVVQNGHVDFRMPSQKSKGLRMSASKLTPTTDALHSQGDDIPIVHVVIDNQHASTQQGRITRRFTGGSRRLRAVRLLIQVGTILPNRSSILQAPIIPSLVIVFKALFAVKSKIDEPIPRLFAAKFSGKESFVSPFRLFSGSHSSCVDEVAAYECDVKPCGRRTSSFRSALR